MYKASFVFKVGILFFIISFISIEICLLLEFRWLFYKTAVAKIKKG